MNRLSRRTLRPTVGKKARGAGRSRSLKRPGALIVAALAMATLALALALPAAASAGVADHTVSGVSPRGTTINLFDYWVDDRDANDQSNPDGWQELGINAGRTLLFGSGMDKVDGLASYNQWTGTAEPYQGIVSTMLGEDGYPTLSAALGGDSLSYLFDTSSFEGKTAYTDAEGLLQVDDEGYYYYDSQKNFAEFDAETGEFTLYDAGGVEAAGSSPDGQFFPFNSGDEVFDESQGSLTANGTTSADAEINHYFGLSMSTRFVQQYDGYTADEGTAGRQQVTYNFSGDDDVWIYVDGVLVGDLGGIHNAASIQINFHTGEVVVYRDGDGMGNDTNNQYDRGETVYERTTLRRLFEEAGVAGDYTWNGDTFADDTYHTLDFFYLERGNTDSNMSLRYNLVNIPESGVMKVDQAGEALAGVRFTLHEANESYEIVEGGMSISAETDATGEMVFTYENASGQETPITLEQLQEQGGDHWVLTEDGIPDGYRSAGDMHLRFEAGVLLSDNEWDTGAWSQPHVTVTAPTTVREADSPGETHESGTGVMFAVVFQRGDDGEWYPVSGNAFDGWVVSDGNEASDVVEAAKADPYQFQLGSGGAYEVTIDDLPGDITSYEYVIESSGGDAGDARYTVRYYWADAESIDGIDGDTEVVRIDADADGGYDGMERMFSVTLNVPNIKNELSLVKTDAETQQPMEGVTFSLYSDDDHDGTADDDTALSTMSTDESGELQVYSDASERILANGSYVLVETTPEGYVEETEPIRIIVDDDGVHVDAGEADDNVTVETGIGSLVYSMKGFAAGDDVDSTLHDVKGRAQTADSYDGTDTAWEDADVATTHYQYDDQSDGLSYVRNDSVADNGGATFTAEAGWSRLDLRQCTQHQGEDPIENKTDLGDQALNALFTGEVTIRVTNSRTPATSSLTISKTVTGEGAPTGATFGFSLTLTDADGSPVTGTFSATTRHADGSEATEDMTISEEDNEIVLEHGESLTIHGLPVGTTYSVTEAAADHYTPSVTPESRDDDLEDGLTSTGEVGVDGATVAFTNTFTGGTVDYDASIDLTVSKRLMGRDMADGEFQIVVDPADDESAALLGLANAEADKVVDMPAATDGDTATVDILSGLDDIEFTAADAGKTFTYAVYERRPAQDPAGGVTYDDARYTLTIRVSAGTDGVVTVHTEVSDETGTLREADTTPGSSGTLPLATFENVYEATGELGGDGATSIKVRKTLENDTLKGDDFTFSVWSVSVGGETVDKLAEAGNDANGDIVFPSIEYATGSLRLDVEKGVAQEGADDSGNTTYTYVYRVMEDTTGFAENGLSASAAQFDVTVVVTDNGDGTLGIAVTYPRGSEDGLEFVNTYGASATASLAVAGTKLYETGGLENAPDIEGAYTFTLTGVDEDGNPAPLPESTTATNQASGTVDFGTIDYDIADLGGADSKTFTYTVTESGSVAGVANDAAAETGRTFSVTLVDNQDGTIGIDADAQQAAGGQFSFTNTYDAGPTAPTDPTDPTGGGLTITKTLDGRALDEGEFSFSMTVSGDYGDAVSPSSITATNTVNEDGTGSIVFDDGFTFTEPGTYVFTISENDNGLGGVSYDASEYTAIAEVEDDGAGHLTVDWTVRDDGGEQVGHITFANSYETAATGAIPLQVAKELRDGALADGQFTFELTGSEGAPMPGDAAGGKATATNASDGTVSFGAVSFDAAGEYDYNVTEVNDGQEGITYDEDATRTIHVSVTDDGKGRLAASVTYGEDGSTFVNSVASATDGSDAGDVTDDGDTVDGGTDDLFSGAPEALPGTGDRSTAAIAVVAALGICAATVGLGIRLGSRRGLQG